MIKIAAAEAEIPFGQNDIAVITVQDKAICIGRYRQQLFAFAQSCPHAGVSLNDGWIDAQGHIVCPLHQYKFSLKTGWDKSGDYLVKRWKVAIMEDGIYLDTTFI